MIVLTAEKDLPRKTHKGVILVAAILLVGLGVALLISGGAIAVMNQTTTDKEGYSLSTPYHVGTSSYAFLIGIDPDHDPADTALTKWVVTSTSPGKELFVGWAWINDSGPYLSGIQFEAPYPYWHWNYGPYSSTISIPTTKTWTGGAPSVLPTQENFWINSAQTSGSATIHYDRDWDNSTLGAKSLVIMNIDGTSNVQADIQLGTKIPVFTWLPLVLIPLGIVLFIAGAYAFTKHAKKQSNT